MDAEINLKNVNITGNNSGLLGGGIYCSNAIRGASITLPENSGISANTTRSTVSTGAGRRGGLYLEGCHFTLYSGTAQSPSNIGIFSNIAESEGGGIYATFGAYVSLYGHVNCSAGNCVGDDDINPVNLTGNSTSNGGALYLKGPSAYAEIFTGLINNNSSTLNGGAIAVMNGTILDVSRVTNKCWDKVRCNFFSGNTAHGNGGAIYNESPNVNIKNVYFEDNRANIGTAIYTKGLNTLAKIDSSVFNHNGNNGVGYSDKHVIRAFSESTIEIVHSTIADNYATNAVLGISKSINSSSELKIYSSIVHDNR